MTRSCIPPKLLADYAVIIRLINVKYVKKKTIFETLFVTVSVMLSLDKRKGVSNVFSVYFHTGEDAQPATHTHTHTHTHLLTFTVTLLLRISFGLRRSILNFNVTFERCTVLLCTLASTKRVPREGFPVVSKHQVSSHQTHIRWRKCKSNSEEKQLKVLEGEKIISREIGGSTKRKSKTLDTVNLFFTLAKCIEYLSSISRDLRKYKYFDTLCFSITQV